MSTMSTSRKTVTENIAISMAKCRIPMVLCLCWFYWVNKRSTPSYCHRLIYKMTSDLFDAWDLINFNHKDAEQTYRAIWFTRDTGYKQWISDHVGNLIELLNKERKYTHSVIALLSSARRPSWAFWRCLQVRSHHVTREGHDGEGHPEFPESIQNNPESSLPQCCLP